MVLVALAVVLSVGALQLVVSSIADALRYEPTALERTIRCLRSEKGLQVATGLRDPVAKSADRGALSTVVEGNPVTIAISSSNDGSIHLSALYAQVAGDLGTRLERRGRIVYLFRFPPSPTQRQALYDCGYS